MSEALATRSLAECEAVIERGLATFVEVGQALLDIRNGRLYRESHSTFESYCREQWAFSDSRGRQLVGAAETVTTVTVEGLPAPSSERVARELPSEPGEARDAWSETVERNGDQPTAAQVREVVQERTRGQLSNQAGGSDEWETPQDLFDVLDAEFGFDVDVCALPSSAKCQRYFTPQQDGLALEWRGVCWMNPPYGDAITEWVAKAHSSSQAGATVVCLVPARVDTGWWWDHCRHGEVRFLRGRLRFGASATSAPFPSAVVVFGPAARQAPDWMWYER